MPYLQATLNQYIDRFHTRYVQNSNGCWEFTGSKCKKGYGRFYFQSKLILAHRFSAKYLGNLSFSDSEVIMHQCDNPSCVNPNHLKAGTQADNLKDMRQKGRRFSKLTSQQREIIKSDTTSKTKDLALQYNVTMTMIQKIRPPTGKKKYGYIHR